MKKIIPLLTITAIGLNGFAAVLTPEQALSRISASPSRKTVESVAKQHPELIDTRCIDDQPAVYMFADSSNGNFILVSADDLVEPLLGYGSCNEENTIENNASLQCWIDEYAAQIEWIRNHASMGSNVVTPVPHSDKETISPLITTTWNQDDPYNYMCPTYYEGYHYPTGCGATAMAQIMNYFKYSSTTFDWVHMLDSYDSGYTATERNAVAKLMYECASAAQTSFKATGSGTAPANVMKGLVSLGYNNNVALAYMNSFSIIGWESFIYDQLRDFGPVLMFGYYGSQGHAFVCDGFTNGYFHINWGWGGSSDGYFKLTAMTPETQGIGGSAGGYNSNVSAIVNICPSTMNAKPNFILTASQIKAKDEEIALGETFTIICTIQNRNNDYFSGDFGFKLVSENTGDYDYFLIKEGVGVWGNSAIFNLTTAIPEETPEGNYKFYIVWKSGDEDWKDLIVGNYYLPYMEIEVKDGKAYFTSEVGALLSLAIKSFESPFFIDSEFSLTASVANNGACDYNSVIFAVLLGEDGETKYAYSGNLHQLLSSGEKDDFDYTSKFTKYRGMTISPGTYNLVFYDNYNRIISPYYPIEIQEKTDTGNSVIEILAEGTSYVGDPEHTYNQNMDIAVNVHVSGGYYIGQIWAQFSEHSTETEPISVRPAASSSDKILYSKTLYIPEDETRIVHLTGSLPSLEVGKDYDIAIYDKSGKLTDNILRLHIDENTTGIKCETVTAAEMIGRCIYSITGERIESEIITPGIYIERKIFSDGTITTRKIMIR